MFLLFLLVLFGLSVCCLASRFVHQCIRSQFGAALRGKQLEDNRPLSDYVVRRIIQLWQ